MINFYDQVPSIYPSASRDFQYLSWLINIVLNSVKHNVDDLYNLPKVGFDSKLSELFALTLGFKIKRNYDQKQLAALAAILPSILKYKGTEKAIKMAAEALITASGALGDTKYEVTDSREVTIKLPKDITIDITLFLDLLDYILPAGMTCRVTRKDEEERKLPNIYVRHRDEVFYEIKEDLSWEDNNLSSGLSGLFNLGTSAKIADSRSNHMIFGSLPVIDFTTNNDKIVIASHESEPPTWSIDPTSGGVSLSNGSRYLTRVVSSNITHFKFEAEAAEWAVVTGAKAGTFRFFTPGDRYFLAYGYSDAGECFYPSTFTSGCDVDLCVYKEAIDDERKNSRTIYNRVYTIKELLSGGNFIILSQNTTPEFAANFKKSAGSLEFNAGLLNNTVIPTVYGRKADSNDDDVGLYSTELDESNVALYASTERANTKIELKAKNTVQEL